MSYCQRTVSYLNHDGHPEFPLVNLRFATFTTRATTFGVLAAKRQIQASSIVSHDVMFDICTWNTRHVSSKIHTARPKVPAVAIIIFTGRLFCRTDVQKETCAKIMITTRPGLSFGRVDQFNKTWSTRPVRRQWYSLDFEILWRTHVRTDRRTTCLKIVITTGRDCKSINPLVSKLRHSYLR